MALPSLAHRASVSTNTVELAPICAETRTSAPRSHAPGGNAVWDALRPLDGQCFVPGPTTRCVGESIPTRSVALVSIYGCHWSYSTSVFLIDSTYMQRLDGEVPGQAVNRRTDFESTCPLSILFIVTGAGPSPIGRPFAEVPTDRVLVDGGNRGFHGLHGPEVPIITSAFLPESKPVGSGPLQDR